MRKPLALAALATLLLGGTAMAEPMFNRIATFSVPDNLPAGRDLKKKTVAEIIAANEAGTLLAYTDAEQKGIGLIDIAASRGGRFVYALNAVAGTVSVFANDRDGGLTPAGSVPLTA